jgi:hypothetical protein
MHIFNQLLHPHFTSYYYPLNIKPPTRKDINRKKTKKSKMKQLGEATRYTQFPKNIVVGALVIARMKPN